MPSRARCFTFTGAHGIASRFVSPGYSWYCRIDHSSTAHEPRSNADRDRTRRPDHSFYVFGGIRFYIFGCIRF